MSDEVKMSSLVNFLKAAAVYKPAVDCICDIVECENCPYYKEVPDDEMPDYNECQGKLRKLHDDIEKEVG